MVDSFAPLLPKVIRAKMGVWNAVFCAYMGVKLNGNQYDYVAKNDVDDRQHGRNAQRHQRGGQGQSGDGDREPQPEISNVFGAPGAVADFGGRQVRVIVLESEAPPRFQVSAHRARRCAEFVSS